jgi:hypothetical protein
MQTDKKTLIHIYMYIHTLEIYMFTNISMMDYYYHNTIIYTDSQYPGIKYMYLYAYMYMYVYAHKHIFM